MCTALLPSIREKYHSSFRLLEIPEVLRFDKQASQYGTVYFRNYVGETYNDRWNESTGGGALGTDLSSEMVRLLEDFRIIDIDWLLQHPVGKRMGEVSFDFQGWLQSFQNRRALAISMGISDAEYKHAEEFMQDGFELTDRILCNGDFYPRNLIKLPQKIVVVDWGYWTGYRACFVDYLVNVVAFAFVHMWNNDPWQKEFLGHVHSVFNPRPEDLRKSILIKAFEQASFWKSDSCLVQPQINHFRMALENEIPLH